MHAGAARLAAEIEPAAEVPDPRRHSRNAHAHRQRFDVVAPPTLLRGKAMSIVGDDQADVLTDTPQAHPDARRPRVPMYIGQCLLHGAQNRLLRRRWQLVGNTVCPQGYAEPRALAEPLHVAAPCFEPVNLAVGSHNGGFDALLQNLYRLRGEADAVKSS
jgi:hypothetical protein